MWSVAKLVRICEERRRGAVRLDGGVEGHSAEELGSGDVLQSQCRADGDVLRIFPSATSSLALYAYIAFGFQVGQLSCGATSSRMAT